jgi:asparagine synthase (glutamine-hydrolysing)
MVAKQYGTDHEEFIVEPNAVEMLPRLAWHYDQPYADSSALPTYYVSQMTRRRVTVALNGDGGDEFFGGYERYRALLVQALYRAMTTPALRDLAERATRWFPERARNHGRIRKLRVFTDDARGGADTFNLSLFNAREFNAGMRHRLYSSAFGERLGPVHAEAYFLGLMAESADQVGPDPVEQALRTDTQMYLPDTLLVKVDIATMAVSLETRSPLLDTAVMEFAASLPRAWKVTRRENKKILKAAYEGILPREVLYRRKMGFSLPLAHWFRHDLYGYTRDILLDRRSLERGYFRPEAVDALIEDHRAGRQNNASRLWALLMLEHWHREILERVR